MRSVKFSDSENALYEKSYVSTVGVATTMILPAIPFVRKIVGAQKRFLTPFALPGGEEGASGVSFTGRGKTGHREHKNYRTRD